MGKNRVYPKIRADLSSALYVSKPNEWVKNMRSLLKEGKVALILGAGVSKQSHLPTWDELLIAAFKKCLHGIPKKDADKLAKSYYKFINNPLYFARFAYNLYEQEKTNKLTSIGSDTFENIIRKELYSKTVDINNNLTLNAVANLCMKSLISQIITYNFDNLLEQKFEKEHFKKFQSITDKYIPPKKPGDKRIYHVHGYADPSKEIFVNKVLNETEFHKQYEDSYNWQNVTQISVFRNYHCLFVGISLTDPNLRRLIDISRSNIEGDKTQHFWIGKLDLPASVSNVASKNVKFKNLIKIGRQLEMKSLGIAPYFVDEFSEIPTVLNSLLDPS